ncbi:hydroquinone glucosyltransferase-like [Carya illinoinensis]|uniref:Uncharacterized protein n=1 Tax=Carya illinoinensis TaxID=32201 RepID=A0A8T1PZ09_CARIL|nr:hydroquinone glucosyltransferase-like [Carya illinoinensis]KAG6647418.1 hypothetical protein CIPAW_07G078000 [Carya illinoinensis]
MGPLIPIVEVAKRLALHHNFHVTRIIPTTRNPSNAIKGILEGLPTGIDPVFLPPVSLEDISSLLPKIQVSLTMTHSLPSVRHMLKTLAETTRFIVVILDHYASDALNIAKEHKVSPYIFFPSNALVLSLLLHLPELDKTVPCEYKNLPEPFKLSGCIPIHSRDLIDPIQDRKGEWYRVFLHLTKQLLLAEGTMLNTFMDLQDRGIKAFADEEARNPPSLLNWTHDIKRPK